MGRVIFLTEEHINNGLSGRCNLCPTALALNKATGRKWSVSKNHAGTIDDQEKLIIRSLPFKVKEFIVRFDGYYTVKPFKFYADIEKAKNHPMYC